MVDLIGVRQTTFGEVGNCLRAAVATITGLPMDQVVDVLDGQHPEEHWFERLNAWAEAHGYEELDVWPPNEPPPGLSLASGTVQRGPQTHAVVAMDGQLVWDPHPSDAFLVEVRYYISWTKKL